MSELSGHGDGSDASAQEQLELQRQAEQEQAAREQLEAQERQAEAEAAAPPPEVESEDDAADEAPPGVVEEPEAETEAEDQTPPDEGELDDASESGATIYTRTERDDGAEAPARAKVEDEDRTAENDGHAEDDDTQAGDDDEEEKDRRGDRPDDRQGRTGEDEEDEDGDGGEQPGDRDEDEEDDDTQAGDDDEEEKDRRGDRPDDRQGRTGEDEEDDEDGEQDGDDEGTDQQGFRQGHGLVKSAEDMSRGEVEAEYREAFAKAPTGLDHALETIDITSEIELALCPPDDPTAPLGQRQEELEAALHDLSQYVVENERYADSGDLTVLHNGSYRGAVLLDAFQDEFRARLEDRPLTDVEQDNIYQATSQVLWGTLAEMDSLGLTETTAPASMSAKSEGRIWGALAEDLAVCASASPGSDVLLTPTPQGIRTNDVSVLYKNDAGLKRELAADIKVGTQQGHTGTTRSRIHVGRIAYRAVEGQQGKPGGERQTAFQGAMLKVADALVREYRSTQTNRTGRDIGVTNDEKAMLGRFREGIAGRVRDLGDELGVPDIIDRQYL